MSMLRGERVNLRALDPSDYPTLALWLNTPEVMKYWGRPGNSQSVAEIAAYEEAKRGNDTTRKYIIETHEGLAIGQIDYYDLDWQARSAWVSILVGDPSYWGGGYGTDSMRTLLRYLFQQLGLHRVALTAHESNGRAIRSYEKNGFVREGVLRDWGFFDGSWVNGVIMSVLAHEFEAVLG
jgi:RimJ/RimL family protein N-acetyltransferase